MPEPPHLKTVGVIDCYFSLVDHKVLLKQQDS